VHHLGQLCPTADVLCAELGVVQLSPWPAVRTVREKIN